MQVMFTEVLMQVMFTEVLMQEMFTEYLVKFIEELQCEFFHRLIALFNLFTIKHRNGIYCLCDSFIVTLFFVPLCLHIINGSLYCLHKYLDQKPYYMELLTGCISLAW